MCTTTETCIYAARTVNSILGPKVIPARKRNLFHHSDACVVHGANVLIAQADFKALHPQVCNACQGEGGNSQYDWGTGFTDFSPCLSCLEKNICPWCAKSLVCDEGEACMNPDCGWQLGMPGYPVIEECGCFFYPLPIREIIEVHGTAVAGFEGGKK